MPHASKQKLNGLILRCKSHLGCAEPNGCGYIETGNRARDQSQPCADSLTPPILFARKEAIQWLGELDQNLFCKTHVVRA